MTAFDVRLQRALLANEAGATIVPPTSWTLVWDPDKLAQVMRVLGVWDDLVEADAAPADRLGLWFQRDQASSPLPKGQNTYGKLYVNLNDGLHWQPMTSQLFGQYLFKKAGAVTSGDLQAEILRAMAAEALLRTDLNAEIARATAAELTERNRALAAEANLLALINAVSGGGGSGLTAVSHDATLTGTGTPSAPLGLATLGTAGTFGDANNIARITTDAYGRITGVTTVPIGSVTPTGVVAKGRISGTDFSVTTLTDATNCTYDQGTNKLTVTGSTDNGMFLITNVTPGNALNGVVPSSAATFSTAGVFDLLTAHQGLGSIDYHFKVLN